MNLRTLAESDLALSLENYNDGFSAPITIKDLSNNSYTGLFCFGSDIAFLIDAQTGVSFRGRSIDIYMRTTSLVTAGAGAIAQNWRAEIQNTNGDNWHCLIKFVDFDRTLGIAHCVMELVNNVS